MIKIIYYLCSIINKKSLTITNMQKKFFLKSIAVLAMGIFTVGCSSDKDVYDPDAATNQVKADYEAEFIRQFGNIAPGHTWGFSSQTPLPKTRGANPEANNWGGYVEVPAPLTEDQLAVVTEWFSTHADPEGIAVNWSDFFVQQVSSTDNGRHMDYLTCGDGDEHIYNFNNGDGAVNGQVWGGELTNPDDQNSRVFHSDKIQFMVESSTTRFGYHNSLDASMYYRYVIIPGDRIDPIVAGMYFVGFDYEAHGQDADKQISPDNFYNDWIVRVTPGLYKNSQRIIAEDFGEIGDFDFNDVVFDVRFEWNAAIITVRAAGGRLPLTIGGVEVHNALGVQPGVMVNTRGQNTVERPVAIFRVPFVNGYNYDYNANNIPVVVNNDGTEMLLTTEPGKAPAKICVSQAYRWAIERISIKTAYPDFSGYVANPSRSNWYTNPVAGTVVDM